MGAVNYLAASPGFKYKDAAAAIAFLERAFGFEPVVVVKDADGSIAHAELWAGDTSIGVSTVRPGDAFQRITPEQAGGITCIVYFVVDDADVHFQRAKAAGAAILYDPMDQDYGGRDYACRDPEGYVWSFGTYRPSREAS